MGRKPLSENERISRRKATKEKYAEKLAQTERTVSFNMSNDSWDTFNELNKFNLAITGESNAVQSKRALLRSLIEAAISARAQLTIKANKMAENGESQENIDRYIKVGLRLLSDPTEGVDSILNPEVVFIDKAALNKDYLKKRREEWEREQQDDAPDDTAVKLEMLHGSEETPCL